jgi:hypothetical protein
MIPVPEIPADNDEILFVHLLLIRKFLHRKTIKPSMAIARNIEHVSPRLS